MAAHDQDDATMQKGTIKRALILGGFIAVAVALITTLWPAYRTVTPLDVYLRQGVRQATETLRREVDTLSPRGADPGPSIQRLNTLGFNCAAPAGAAGEWNCTMRRPLENRQMLSMEVILRVERSVVTDSTARIWEQPGR